MSSEISLKEMRQLWKGKIRTYIVGFILSFFLTTLSFCLVMFKVLPPQVLIYTVSGLALLQAVIQLRLFLHLGEEGKPRWETFVFFFTLLMLSIVVLGSLWVMHDLNQRMM